MMFYFVRSKTSQCISKESNKPTGSYTLGIRDMHSPSVAAFQLTRICLLALTATVDLLNMRKVQGEAGGIGVLPMTIGVGAHRECTMYSIYLYSIVKNQT